MVEHPLSRESGEFFWCLLCWRAHAADRWATSRWDCPEPGCHGSTIEALEWTGLRNRYRKVDRWPEAPEEGACYPLSADSCRWCTHREPCHPA